jgi:hypothetical protein
MAVKGSKKWFSEQHEERIAGLYRATRSRSSGAAEHDQGDVRARLFLIECKHTGSFDKPARSISVKLDDLEKIADEARSEGKLPMVALSIYCPASPLADYHGYVDLCVRLANDDIYYHE